VHATQDSVLIYCYAVCTHSARNALIFELELANVDVQAAVNHLDHQMFANFIFRYNPRFFYHIINQTMLLIILKAQQ
jgi:hypothetical protein